MDASAAPVVLFFPARDEAPSVGAVVARTPRHVRGHPVRCVVVDDGSTDETARIAAAAGASVIRQAPRGLGSAVRTGLAAATALDAVRRGFRTVVPIAAVAAVDLAPGDGERALDELRRAGVAVA